MLWCDVFAVQEFFHAMPKASQKKYQMFVVSQCYILQKNIHPRLRDNQDD